MKTCNTNIFEISSSDIDKLSNVIVHGQDERIKLLNAISKSVKFNFGMRSKTKYSSKLLMDIINKAQESIKPFLNVPKSCTRNRVLVYSSAVGVGVTGAYLCTDQISEALTTYSELTNIFPFIDLGFRVDSNLGYSFDKSPLLREDPTFMITFVINLALFGATMVNDWQAYLITPSGSKVILDLISANPVGLLSMVTHANIFGTSENDILKYFLKINKTMCAPEAFGDAVTKLEKLENTAKAFLINKAMFQLLTLGGSYGFWIYIANYPIYKLKQEMEKSKNKS